MNRDREADRSDPDYSRRVPHHGGRGDGGHHMMMQMPPVPGMVPVQVPLTMYDPNTGHTYVSGMPFIPTGPPAAPYGAYNGHPTPGTGYVPGPGPNPSGYYGGPPQHQHPPR